MNDVGGWEVYKSGRLAALLVGSNVGTCSKLAFAVGSPQKPPSDEEFNAFCASLNFGTELSIAETAAVKRIKFESLTIVLANLKSKATTDFMWPAQKIPNAEKQARLISQPEAVRN